MRYFLSLGSNLGDRSKNLIDALSLLTKEGIKVLKTSSVYETQPVGFSHSKWFYNQVAEVSTDFDPSSLLAHIKKIEIKMGREPSIRKHSRPIDIDILLAENTVIQTKTLRIPHPKMERRNFVLIPLTEISPETIHPLLKKKIKYLMKNSKDSSLVKRANQNNREKNDT